MPDYDAWNRALIAHFVEATPSGAPVFLAVSDDALAHIGQIVLSGGAQADNETPVGTQPAYIAITPDDQYALVLNQASGDMAVIRVPNVTRTINQRERRVDKKGPLFMLIPVGSKPVSATIVAI